MRGVLAVIVLESLARQSQQSEASLLWGLAIVVVFLVAAMVIGACLAIRFMTRPTPAPPVTHGALEQLQERRSRGEVSDEQFELAWSMLRAAEEHQLLTRQRHGDAEAAARS